MRRWVLASSNAGKLREFEHALGDVLRGQGIELVNQSTLGVTGAEEPHLTFQENALAKARHASRATGCPALADDSGIAVAALHEAPGVRSARYFEDALAMTSEELALFQREHRDASPDALNLHWLLNRMRKAKEMRYPDSDPPDSFWGAAFVTVIALVRNADDANPVIVTGRWEGRVTLSPQGAQGFGYDPIFFDPSLGRTAAQLSLAEKEQVSHRGQALRLLKQALPNVLQSALP